MAVRGTTNYVYYTDQSLGVGATGNVYFGRHKRRGDPCAIKVFRSADGGNKELLLRQREFAVMSKLDHENIVKFIAIEPESHGNDRVLIMELCTGGSVYKMLEEPENAFGFSEDEFLLFLRDITKALQYLRQNGVIHRDIKPGNILRYIKDDLGSVYKLTDFGAARELPEDGEFMSLYGTEEYLHPDLYARALLGGGRSDLYPRSFNASVDLWSLGVTLYHVATGRLPFQPFGGRKNKEAMHSIISKKESGFISGVQLTKDGHIEWSRDLPRTCGLSWGLKQLLIPILVGLLESERKRQWNFETFFRMSEDISARLLIHVFSVSNCSHNRLYLSEADRKSIAHFHESLAEMTKIPANHQILFHERWSVESLVPTAKSDKNGLGRNGIQKTSLKSPLCVLPKSYVSTEWLMETTELPQCPVVPSTGDISEDASFVRNACAYSMFLHEQTKRLQLAQCFLAACVSHLQNLLTTSFQESQLLLLCLTSSYEKLLKVQSSGMTLSGSFASQTVLLKEKHKIIEDELSRLNSDFSSQYLLTARYFKALSNNNLCQVSCCAKKQKHLVKELETIKNIFREHKRKEKDLSYNDQQIHKFDRTRAADGTKKSLKLYSGHCSVATSLAWKEFQSCHSIYSQRRSEIEETEKLLHELHDEMKTAEESLYDVSLQRSSSLEWTGGSTKAGNSGKVGYTDAVTETSQPRWIDDSSDDSAFLTGIKSTGAVANVNSSDRQRLGSSGESHTETNAAVFWTGPEAIPEDLSRADSGIEMLTGILKETLQINSDNLKKTMSRSEEMDFLVNRLCSQFQVS